MPSAFKRSVANADLTNDAAAGVFDSGKIEHRTGTPPANITDASTGTLLATNNFAATAFGPSSANLATANAISSATAVASGDAGYFRCYASGAADTAASWEGSSGEAADTPDMTFDNKTVVSGGTVAISSLTYASKITQ